MQDLVCLVLQQPVIDSFRGQSLGSFPDFQYLLVSCVVHGDVVDLPWRLPPSAGSYLALMRAES
jgi:hypothetical protein